MKLHRSRKWSQGEDNPTRVTAPSQICCYSGTRGTPQGRMTLPGGMTLCDSDTPLMMLFFFWNIMGGGCQKSSVSPMSQRFKHPRRNERWVLMMKATSRSVHINTTSCLLCSETWKSGPQQYRETNTIGRQGFCTLVTKQNSLDQAPLITSN